MRSAQVTVITTEIHLAASENFWQLIGKLPILRFKKQYKVL